MSAAASFEKVKRRRAFPEMDLQRAVAKMLELCLPYDATFTAIPGGDRGVTLCPGYRSGWPDVQIIAQGKALCIELKSREGRLTESQKKTIPVVKRAGAPVVVCRSLDEVAAFCAANVPGWKGRITA